MRKGKREEKNTCKKPKAAKKDERKGGNKGGSYVLQIKGKINKKKDTEMGGSRGGEGTQQVS